MRGEWKQIEDISHDELLNAAYKCKACQEAWDYIVHNRRSFQSFWKDCPFGSWLLWMIETGLIFTRAGGGIQVCGNEITIESDEDHWRDVISWCRRKYDVMFDDSYKIVKFNKDNQRKAADYIRSHVHVAIFERK